MFFMLQRKNKKSSQIKIINQLPTVTARLTSLKIAPRGDLGGLPTTNPRNPLKTQNNRTAVRLTAWRRPASSGVALHGF